MSEVMVITSGKGGVGKTTTYYKLEDSRSMETDYPVNNL